MKIAFFGIAGHSRYTYAGEMKQIDSMPRSAGTNISKILETYSFTGNKGNMFHGEAPTRILECDRSNSCYVSVEDLVYCGWSPERISEELSQRFDLVVYSTANAVRPNHDPGCTADVLDLLKVDFIVLGMGLQNPIAHDTDQLHPNLIKLLDVSNRKAKIFGVRGLDTESWLNQVGYTRAHALGCPSMYVYPQNLLNLKSVEPSKIKSALTGGYIHGRIARSSAIIWAFKNFDAHYIMQEEMDAFNSRGLFDAEQDIYNDATGEVNKNLLENILKDIHQETMPFTSYRWFQDPNAWRAFSSRFDFYLGDRLHGGIASMQAGTPSIIMTEDRRVGELTEFFAIPSTSVNEIEDYPLKDIVAMGLNNYKLNELKSTYADRFSQFKATLEGQGINLTNNLPGKPSAQVKLNGKSNVNVSRSVVRFMRKMLRRL